MARLRGLFWPEDLAAVQPGGVPVFSLPVAIHPAFTSQSPPGLEETAGLDLPEQHVLYHGPQDEHPARLLETWGWPPGRWVKPASALGLHETSRNRLDALLPGMGWAQLRALPGILRRWPKSAGLFRRSTPGPSPWGDPVRPALACGRPVVASNTTLTDAIVGPSAYLAPATEARALGAALITTLIEEEVAGRLSKAALERAATWQSASFGARLLDAYQQILSFA
jgi:glycosyltransferase involved in cell wall biosynthesis